ncbi:hypothetical protein [Serratia marcescens]|uniref:hypothetical protein n=1 Tax=Serratia marcescens TaxID=615 RepID=UPI002178DD44|nr:hypothetical protein [Serratia marcescens]CAI1970545.1 Uncharacterised protein [Serratia marcescens]
MKCTSITNQGRPWKKSEIDFLCNNVRSLCYRKIAYSLGRTTRGVREKARELKVNPGQIGEANRNVKYSDHDVDLCRALHEKGIKPRIIARKMEMPIKAVYAIVYFRVRKQPTPAPRTARYKGSSLPAAGEIIATQGAAA